MLKRISEKIKQYRGSELSGLREFKRRVLSRLRLGGVNKDIDDLDSAIWEIKSLQSNADAVETIGKLWNQEVVRRSKAEEKVKSLRLTLLQLADATEHLLKDHDCDTRGHEAFKRALNEARAYLKGLENPLSRLPPEARETMDEYSARQKTRIETPRCYCSGSHIIQDDGTCPSCGAFHGQHMRLEFCEACGVEGRLSFNSSRALWICETCSSKLGLPPLPEVAVFEAAREELRNMTPEQLRQTLVDAGIATEDGQLTERYRERE